MVLLLCLFSSLLVGITNAHPYREYQPQRYYPQHAMMFNGFYRRPNDYSQGSVSAFLSGDTLATNSFSGDDFPISLNPSETSIANEERPLKKHPELAEPDLSEQEEVYAEEDTYATSTSKPKRLPKRKQKPTPKPVDDEEGDEDTWPIHTGSRGGVPAYNAFFPIVFGGPAANSRSGSGESGGGYPGSATAIANSFSTGKGGVASSHATAYGDPYLSTLLRNQGISNTRKTQRSY